MPSSSWDEANQLVLETLAQPESQRQAFLDKCCQDNPALREEVLLILTQHESRNAGALAVAETADMAAAASRVSPSAKNLESAPSPSPDNIAALWNARYEIVERIGAGGMGVVYRGRHRQLNMEVAIKVLKRGESSDRFLREARALAQLKSPHVVRIHDYEVLPGGFPVLVMEWIAGRDLGQTTRDFGGRIDERYALAWMRQVCQGMQTASADGIIHRDLKPSNILIDGHNQAKVADFGLARTLGASHDLSLTGSIMGTPYYMAPEQAEDPRRVDSRADVYSFGATFYHVLTGSPPFDGETTFSVLFKHKTEPLISPRARFAPLSERTSQILERCLAKSPADRFQSFGAILRQLEPSALEVSPWNATDSEEFSETLGRFRARREAYLTGPRPLGQVDTYTFPDNRSIKILFGDLVDQEVDAVVSSVDGALLMDGGVAAVIRTAAGEQIVEEAARFAPVRPGRAIVTSAGKLKARFIFHGVTMGDSGDRYLAPSPDLVSEILSSCFYHADTLSVRSIAFPLLGTGAGRLPKGLCLDTTFRYLCRAFACGMTAVREARIVLSPSPALNPVIQRSDDESADFLDPPTIKGYSFFDHAQAADATPSGFCRFIPLSAGRLAIVLGKQCGHGIAPVSEGFLSEVIRILSLQSDAATALDQLNVWLCQTNTSRFTNMIVTMLDPQRHVVNIANAGHLLPIHLKPTGEMVDLCADQSGLPLGVTDQEKYDSAQLTLDPGGIIVFTTDGLIEAMNVNCEFYGKHRLASVLRQHAGPAKTLGQAVIADITQFLNKQPPNDDLILIALGRD